MPDKRAMHQAKSHNKNSKSKHSRQKSAPTSATAAMMTAIEPIEPGAASAYEQSSKRKNKSSRH